MYTHTRKRANGLLRSGGRQGSLRMLSSSSTEYTLWQTDSMKTFSPSQHVARRSVIASSSCRSGVSRSYKRRERIMELVTKMFSSPSTPPPTFTPEWAGPIASFLFLLQANGHKIPPLSCWRTLWWRPGCASQEGQFPQPNTHIGKRKKIAQVYTNTVNCWSNNN